MDQANPLAGLTHKRRLSLWDLAVLQDTSPAPAVVPTFLPQSATSSQTRTTPGAHRPLRDRGSYRLLALYAHVNEYGFI